MSTTSNTHRDFIGTSEAADIIGCTDGRVRQMLRDGILIGQKMSNRVWLIDESEARRVRDTERRPGPA